MAATAERIACPVEGCDATFAQRYNVSRHVQEKHGVDPDSAEFRQMGFESRGTSRKQASYSTEVDAQIAETVKPLKETLRRISKRMEEIDAERQQLIIDRRRIMQVLKVIDPSSFVAAPKKRGVVNATHVGSPEMKDAKRKAFNDWIDAHRADYDEGLIASQVYRDMKEAGVEPISSPSVVLEYIRDLHAQGVLRADKKVRGGAVSYKFNGG